MVPTCPPQLLHKETGENVEQMMRGERKTFYRASGNNGSLFPLVWH